MKEYTFVFTEEEANIILSGLAELPFKVANGVVAKIQEQAAEQLEAQEEPESE